MYADLVEAGPKLSVKERLHGNTTDDLLHRRSISGKRPRRVDDKWEHDLYENNGPQVPSHKVGAKDLRLKLQRKGIQNAHQSGKGSLSGMRDLHDKLSGARHPQPGNSNPPKPKSAVEAGKTAKKILSVEVPPLETKEVVSPVPKEKKKKTESVDGFLQSLNLEKYSITFQAEEVDMTVLLHMSDEDLKALGIPMGPRKKIRLALDSRP